VVERLVLSAKVLGFVAVSTPGEVQPALATTMRKTKR